MAEVVYKGPSWQELDYASHGRYTWVEFKHVKGTRQSLFGQVVSLGHFHGNKNFTVKVQAQDGNVIVLQGHAQKRGDEATYSIEGAA